MKRTALILLCIMFAAIFIACQSNSSTQQTLNSSISADSDIDNILIKPFPFNGKVVATIQGSEYIYDPSYLFQLTMDSKWDTITPNKISEAIWQELIAIEGMNNSPGFVIPENALCDYVEQRKIKYFDDSFESNKINIDHMNDIINQKNISYEEFWENQKDYVLKYHYISIESSRIWDDYQPQDETSSAEQYFQDYMNHLMKKYDVKLVEY